MLKFIPLTALALGLSSGVALADRHDGDHRGGDHRAVTVEHRAPQVVRDHRDSHSNAVVVRDRGNWHGGGRVIVRNSPSYHRDYRVVRRPIYVSRPVIRAHYFDHYRRPALIVENYGPRAGYYWVAGRWDWTGYEWQWQPGHYEPDPRYIEPAYGGGYYDNGYYDNGY
jgi:hypothetical protein